MYKEEKQNQQEHYTRKQAKKNTFCAWRPHQAEYVL